MDRIEIDLAGLGPVHGAMWEWLERRAEVKSGWGPAHFLKRLRSKDDSPARLEDLIRLLRQAGFAADCLHLVLDRALIAAVKA